MVELDGNPWFVAADVFRCLGFAVSKGTYHRLLSLGADEKRQINRREHPSNFEGSPASLLAVISESGLYKLIMRAQPDRNSAVRKFQDWVTREVLPAIRRKGGYVMGEEKLKTGR